MKQASCMNPTDQNWDNLSRRGSAAVALKLSGSVADLTFRASSDFRVVIRWTASLPSDSTCNCYLFNLFVVTVVQVGSSMQKPLDAALLWLANSLRLRYVKGAGFPLGVCGYLQYDSRDGTGESVRGASSLVCSFTAERRAESPNPPPPSGLVVTSATHSQHVRRSEGSTLYYSDIK